MTAAPALIVRALSRRYGRVLAVDAASFQLNHGEIGVLVGPSGCGKSTLLRLIAGLESPDPDTGAQIIIGERTVFDADTALNVPADQRGVGLVFQDYALFPHMTVAENIAFGLHRWPKKERRARVQEMLRWVRLEALAERYPHELSGGQQQRVALARALAPRPALVLLDEPFSNLDQNLRSELREEMRALIKQSNTPALFVTHDREEAISLADTLLVMHEGRIIQTGTPHTLYWQPETLTVATLLGEVNVLEGIALDGHAECALGRVPLVRSAQGRVRLALRPEAVHAVPAADGEAVIERVTYFGHDQLLTVRLQAGDTVLVRASGVHRFSLGQRVHLALAAPAAVLQAT